MSTTVCVELNDLSSIKREEILEAILKETDDENQEPEGSFEFWVHLEIDDSKLEIQ